MPVEEFSYERRYGLIDLEDLEKKSRRRRRPSYPIADFFGTVENVKAAAELAHAKGALLAVPVHRGCVAGNSCAPVDADIVAGELQWFAIHPATVVRTRASSPPRKIVRRCPAGCRRNQRLARSSGLLPDPLHARTAYPREKATSNICTNQALIALMATVFMTVYGGKACES